MNKETLIANIKYNSFTPTEKSAGEFLYFSNKFEEEYGSEELQKLYYSIRTN